MAALVFFFLFFTTTMSGCLAPSAPGPAGSGAAFLVRGQLDYEIIHRDISKMGHLRVGNMTSAGDRFLDPKQMIPATERVGDGLESHHWIDPSSRRIELTEKVYDGWHTKDFGARTAPPGDQGLLMFLMLLHGRDWQAEDEASQWISGHHYRLTASWDEKALVVDARSSAQTFEVRYQFRTKDLSLSNLESLRMTAPGQDYTYIIRNVPDHLEPYWLADESSRPLTPWRPVAQEEFLEQQEMPFDLPLRRAWDHVGTDPRAAEWDSRGAQLRTAFYESSTNGVGLSQARWSLVVDLEDGRAHVAVEESNLEGTSLLPVTTRFDESAAADSDLDWPGWYPWDDMLRNCAEHLQVRPKEVIRVAFGPPELASGLEYHGHVLQLAFMPEGGEFAQVGCDFDTLEGLPIRIVGAPTTFVT